MNKILKRITNTLAIVLTVISIVLVALMYLGGTSGQIEVAGDMLDVPKFTDPLLYWSYGLLALAILVAIVFAIIKFGKNVADNPKSALKTLIPLVIFALLFVIGWNMGTGERIAIPGYEGTQNEGFWAQLSDMFIYVTYFLLAGVVLAIIGNRIYVKLK